MRNRLFAVLLALVMLPLLIVIPSINPVFADHTYLGWTVDHANYLFNDFVIDYRSYGGEITNIQADINSKKLFLDVKITATPAFLEIDLPRNLLDTKDSDKDGDFKIIYEGNRAGFDEIQTLWNIRTLNIQLRGASVSEIVELEIMGTHIFDKTTLKEPEDQELDPEEEQENKEKTAPKENLETKTTKETKSEKTKEINELEPETEIETEVKVKSDEEIENTNENEPNKTIETTQTLEHEILEPDVELELQIELEKEINLHPEENTESQKVLEINEEPKFIVLDQLKETKTKQKHEPQPKPALTAIQMIELVRMFEPIQKIEPQVVESVREIFEPKYDESDELELEVDMEPKEKLTPEHAAKESIISTYEPTTLINTNSDELTPEKELEPIVNNEEEHNIVQEDSCFICKNKKKQGNKELHFQQLEEPVVQQEPVIEEQKSEVNFLSKLIKQFQGLFGWMIFNLFSF